MNNTKYSLNPTPLFTANLIIGHCQHPGLKLASAANHRCYLAASASIGTSHSGIARITDHNRTTPRGTESARACHVNSVRHILMFFLASFIFSWLFSNGFSNIIPVRL